MTELYRGIDIGAFNCACASASVEKAEDIGVDVNALGNRATPTVVALEGRQRLIGEA